MYLFYMYSGLVVGTTSKYQIPYIREQYRDDIAVESFMENLDRAIEIVDIVVE